VIIKDEKAMLRLGARLATVLRPGDVVTLSGALSAGKTTMVRGLLQALGHRGEVPSPSFAIVQPYEEIGPPIWHVDLYRIENPADIEELGLDDIRVDGVLIVEWPEHGGKWSNALALSLEVLEDCSRSLTASVPEAWEGRWPPP
jgi:tRNA threonylcarbamoyladenosine biosynthesis protein TsaE